MSDPNDRRRIDAEAMRERDAEVAKLRRAGTPFRAIAERLGMSLGGVQKALVRAQKTAPLLVGAPASDDELSAEDPELTAADVERLNELERYRLRYVPGEFGVAERGRVTAERAAERQQFMAEHAAEIALVGYQRAFDEHHRTRVSDGQSWRDGVDRALSDDSGVDCNEDDW